eukprot:30390-Pelagococcus_subviridis.AAC.2
MRWARDRATPRERRRTRRRRAGRGRTVAVPRVLERVPARVRHGLFLRDDLLFRHRARDAATRASPLA